MKQSHIYLKLQAADSRWLLFIDALDAIGLLWDWHFDAVLSKLRLAKSSEIGGKSVKSFGAIAILSDLTGVTLTVDSSNSEQVEFSDGLAFDLIKLTNDMSSPITSVPNPRKLFRSSPSKCSQSPKHCLNCSDCFVQVLEARWLSWTWEAAPAGTNKNGRPS